MEPVSIGDIPKKKRGRKPTTGRGEGVLVRLHQPMLGAIDEAAKAHDGIGRAEMIRRALVEWLKSHGFLHRNG
jgi:Ribbon-helix-helix protein, copG family